MKVATLLVSLLTLATGVEAVPKPLCKDIPSTIPFQGFCDEGDKCEPEQTWGNCPNNLDAAARLGCSSKGVCRFFCDVTPCDDADDVCVQEGNLKLCVPVPSPVPSPVPTPVPTPGPSCEDLADDTKKGKKRCKLAKKCNKLGPKCTVWALSKCNKPKLAIKCMKGCRKDFCKKFNKKTFTCKKKGKNVCPKTCCNLSIHWGA